MFLISGWVVAASLVAEKANVGMAVVIADITSMCGFGSDGAAALLSACSFVRCCSHQFVFSCLEVLFQAAKCKWRALRHTYLLLLPILGGMQAGLFVVDIDIK